MNNSNPTVKTYTTPTIPTTTVYADDTSLQLINGQWYYHDTLYSGRVEMYYTTGVLQSRQSYYHGKEEGWATTWFENGQQSSKRYYRAGEKEGVHTGWWEDGVKRFEYHFSQGLYQGDFTEWSVDARMVKYILYENGKERSGKAWRDNGKLYMSFEVRDGRRYGLMNAKPCYTLRNEKGEFVEVIVKKKSPL